LADGNTRIYRFLFLAFDYSFINSDKICLLTNQQSLALAVPLARFTSRVGSGSDFYDRRKYEALDNSVFVPHSFARRMQSELGNHASTRYSQYKLDGQCFRFYFCSRLEYVDEWFPVLGWRRAVCPSAAVQLSTRGSITLMHGFIAMAGLAEAAFFFELLIIGGIVLIAAGLLALSLWKRSLVAVVIACVLILVAGILLQPWAVFSPPTTDDPDEADWLVRFRIASVIWALFVGASAACLARVLRHRRLKRNAQNAV